MRSSKAPPPNEFSFDPDILALLPVLVCWIAPVPMPKLPDPADAPVGMGLSIWFRGAGIPAGCAGKLASSVLPPKRSMSSSSGFVLFAAEAMADCVAVEPG